MSGVSEVPAFTIEETGGRKRKVTLIGRGLPFRPLNLDAEQRVKITNPAGNPEGFGTVMGPTYGETQIDGFWKNKYIGTGATEQPAITLTQPRSPNSNAQGNTTGTQVGSVQDAVQLFESIVAEGQLLEVTWGWVIRRGYLKKFSPKIHNIHDVEWSATFAWISKALPTTATLFDSNAGRLNTARGLRSLLDRLARIVDMPQSMMREYMDTYRNLITRIATAVVGIEEAAVGLIDEVSPAREVARIQALLGGIATAATDIVDTMESVGWAGIFERPQQLLPFASAILPHVTTPEWSATPEGERSYQQLLDAIDPVKILEAQLYVRETITDARRIRDEAEARRRALDSGPGYALGTYRAREGEDLRDVSQLYYNTPNEWRALMLYNGFTTTELYAGQYVAIPRLNTAGESI